MTLASFGAALTAIREVIDSAGGSLRQINAGRFADALHEGVSDDELARRGILAAKPFRVRLGNIRRHPASPPINGNINLLAFEAEVVVSRTIDPEHQVDPDAMAELEALAAEDADALRQALCTPPNLNTTADGTATNLVGGHLVYLRSSTPRVVTGAPPAKAQRFEVGHRFEGTLKVYQNV